MNHRWEQLEQTVARIQEQQVEDFRLVMLALGQTRDGLQHTQDGLEVTQKGLRQTQEALQETQEALKETQEALKETQEALKETQEGLEQVKVGLGDTRTALGRVETGLVQYSEQTNQQFALFRSALQDSGREVETRLDAIERRLDRLEDPAA